MKTTLDTKSILIGILTTGLCLTIISSKNHVGPTDGRYKTEVNNNNVVVILDTQTGQYIIAPEVRDAGKIQWLKGECKSKSLLVRYQGNV
jgi:hypothetical protein